jgi:hypothetical protein
VTLATAFVTGDGIVIAADSRTSLHPSEPSRVFSDFTHKVFFKVADVAVATYGWAFLLNRNIAGHMPEFAQQFADKQPSVDEVCRELGEFFGERLERHCELGVDVVAEGATAMGFLVGGYDDGVGRAFEVLLPSKAIEPIADTTEGGGCWRGQTDVVTRLIKGADLEMLAVYAGQLGLEQQVADLNEGFTKLEYVLAMQGKNLQDAVDLAVLLIRTTIDIQRLTNGTIGSPRSWPGVGGPIEIATVTAVDGFSWLQQTPLLAERPSGDAERI